MYFRSQLDILETRIQEPRRFIQVLAGPRQVGKTTLIRQFIERTTLPWHFAAADAPVAANSAWLQEQWDIARLKKRQLDSETFVFIIDEIQKIPNWSDVVKANWDSDTWNNLSIQVILLGSAQLIIQQGLTESLAGRFELIYMPHWSLAEMESAFAFTPQEFIWFGGYPGAAPLIKDEPRWQAYVRDSLIETTLSRDILQLTRVDKPALLRRLFELSCAYSGRELSYNKMLGQLQDAGNTTTLAHYLHLLSGAGMVTGLEKYTAQPVRTRASSPKLQVLNNAFLSVYSGMTFSACYSSPEQWGRQVESAIGAHLVNTAKKGEIEIYYWRERDKEVNFVLRKGTKVIGIEVKSGGKAKISGVEAFRRAFKPEVVLFVGPQGLREEEFLRTDPVTLFQ